MTEKVRRNDRKGYYFVVIPVKTGIQNKKHNGFPLEFTPCLTRGGNDRKGFYFVVTPVKTGIQNL